MPLEIKLVTEEYGYKDYDVSGHPDGIHRAKVSPRLSKGDIFNVYLGESTKMGCEWLGTVEKSLAAFSATS